MGGATASVRFATVRLQALPGTHTPLRMPRPFCYNPAIQPQGSADAERGPGSQEPGS